MYTALLKLLIRVKGTVLNNNERVTTEPAGGFTKSFATGDAGAIRVLAAITKQHRKIMDNAVQYADADEIVYCLGDHFSIAQLVSQLEAHF